MKKISYPIFTTVILTIFFSLNVSGQTSPKKKKISKTKTSKVVPVDSKKQNNALIMKPNTDVESPSVTTGDEKEKKVIKKNPVK